MAGGRVVTASRKGRVGVPNTAAPRCHLPTALYTPCGRLDNPSPRFHDLLRARLSSELSTMVEKCLVLFFLKIRLEKTEKLTSPFPFWSF